jgi:hypothetical protein
MGKEVIKTIRVDYTNLITKRWLTVYEVYPTSDVMVLKSFKRRKHARKFAKR